MRQTFAYQIFEINYFTPKHLQLLLRPTAESIPYEAGQYLEILYPDGKYLPFSIANAPREDGELELHLKLSPTDIPTLEFIDQSDIGTILTIAGPLGECQYQHSNAELILLAAGTGFAPVKAIIEKVLQTNDQRVCHLYWTVKHSADIYLPDLPLRWQATLPNFSYTKIVTQEISENKLSILDKVSNDFNSYDNCQVYVFGPENLALAALEKLIKHGLKKELFFSDMLTRERIAKSI